MPKRRTAENDLRISTFDAEKFVPRDTVYPSTWDEDNMRSNDDSDRKTNGLFSLLNYVLYLLYLQIYVLGYSP